MYPLWRAFSKSSVFAVHTMTGKRRFPMYHSGERFRKVPFSSVFGDRRHQISVDERPNRIKKFSFANKNWLVCGRGLRLDLEPFLRKVTNIHRTLKWRDDCKPMSERYLHVHGRYVKSDEAREQVFDVFYGRLCASQWVSDLSIVKTAWLTFVDYRIYSLLTQHKSDINTAIHKCLPRDHSFICKHWSMCLYPILLPITCNSFCLNLQHKPNWIIIN